MTPLCQAANWSTTNVDVVIQMVQFVIESFEEPGLLTFIIIIFQILIGEKITDIALRSCGKHWGPTCTF